MPIHRMGLFALGLVALCARVESRAFAQDSIETDSPADAVPGQTPGETAPAGPDNEPPARGDSDAVADTKIDTDTDTKTKTDIDTDAAAADAEYKLAVPRRE